MEKARSDLRPIVYRNCIESWPASTWNPSDLIRLFGDQETEVRFGPIQHTPGEILWETKSPRMTTTVSDFVFWASGKKATEKEEESESISSEYPSSTYWGYLDYKYLFQLLPAEQMNVVRWSDSFDGLGRRTQNASDSTIWFGTKGAYTPCHYDTYGFNLHAQLHGSKRWILFPPETPADAMRPTRLPFEESSVFSDVDMLSAPDCLRNAPEICVVTINQGDVLFLPPYWWHSVQCVGDADSGAISVNTWIPIEEDATMRLRETVTKGTFALLDDGGLIPTEMGLAPSEQNQTPAGSSDDEVQDLLNAFSQLSAKNEEASTSASKRSKTSHQIITVDPWDFVRRNCDKEQTIVVANHQTSTSSSLESLRKQLYCDSHGTVKQQQQNHSAHSQQQHQQSLTRYDLMKAILQPDVQHLISQHLNRMQNKTDGTP